MTDQVVAVDYECYYGDDLSVKRQGPKVYASLTQIFMVGLYSPTVQYVGPVEEAPWESIEDHHWVSHNAGFDQAVFSAACARGMIRDCHGPRHWDCTADLSAYMGIGRKLEEAVRNSFQAEVPKTIRKRAGNRHWPDDFNPKMQEDFRRYCLADAEWCYKLWERWHSLWPEEERLFANIVRFRGAQGILVNQDRLAQMKSILELRVREALAQIPWEGSPDSRKQMIAWCESMGVPPPASTAEKSEVFAAWIEKHGADFPQIFWLKQWRKANKRLRNFESIERRIMLNGRCNFVLKYHGAGNTGRLSGADGLNMQNLNRDSEGGVDLRSVFVAAPEKILIITDFAQVEPRVVAWVCKDQKLLSQLVAGMNFYEADARLAGVWEGEPGTFKKDKARYQLQKAQSLGIGYGMGANRFIQAAKQMLGLDFTHNEAASIIAKWHARYPGVRKVWNKLEQGLNRALMLKETLVISLPSGRKLQYYDLRREDGRITGATAQGSKRRMRYWGGMLFENVIQAIARDVLRDAILRLESQGIPVVFSSHDETVCEVDLSFPPSEIVRIMTIPPTWALDLPLGAEATASAHYLK